MSQTSTAAQENLLALLAVHVPSDEVERGHLEHIRAFVARESRCFHRDTLPGHITGSAFIVDPTAGMMLLHHHRKLDRWLQMGGHDNGEQDACATALREAIEESGLSRLHLQPAALDVDVHRIPENQGQPAHDHLDIRFLVLGDVNEPLVRDDAESVDLRWFPLEDAARQMSEVGAIRVLAKVLSRIR